jgi:hypothetical protein
MTQAELLEKAETLLSRVVHGPETAVIKPELEADILEWITAYSLLQPKVDHTSYSFPPNQFGLTP